MRVIVQRVKSSQVEITGNVVSKIGRGLNLLVGIADDDTEAELDWMVRKCLNLRLFPDSENNNEPWKKSGKKLNVVGNAHPTLHCQNKKNRSPY